MRVSRQINAALYAFEGWSSLGLMGRVGILSRDAAGLVSNAAEMAQWQIDNALTLISVPEVLQEPTGGS